MPKYDESDRKTAYRLYRKGWGYLRISQIIGCTSSTVRKWILAKGIDPRPASGHSDDFREKVMREYTEREDLSLDKVARKNGINPTTLARWLHNSGVYVRPTRPRIVDRDSLIRDIESGLPKEEIARRNNCSVSWVYTVQRGDG